MGQPILNFKDLKVYQEACTLDELIFEESKRWPKEEKYALVDQIRRSSRSIGANLAEAWAKRRYEAHFVSKLTDADAELQETEHWLWRAFNYGYLSIEKYEKLNECGAGIGKRLGKMIANPNSFVFRE
jgi:four helix bundle protein